MIKLWLAGAGISVVLAYLAKKLPDIVGKWLDKQIDKLYELGDDDDDEVFNAVGRWAKIKLSRSVGATRIMKAEDFASKIVAVLPAPARVFLAPKTKKLAEIIVKLLDKTEQVINENLEEHSDQLPH